MRVAIVQSSYIPWKGYFDLIASVDTFVLYDDAQYTRRDWRNRNRIKTATGPIWLTIPVEVGGKYLQRVRDVAIADERWASSHWKTLQHQYRRTPGFADYGDTIEELYRTACTQRLSDVNYHFLSNIAQLLGIETTLRWSHEFDLSGDRSGKLLSICRQLKATEYVSGPSAREYLDEQAFTAAGVGVSWADYSGYPEYRQPYPPFDHQVSIVDLLLSEGRDARRFLKCA